MQDNVSDGTVRTWFAFVNAAGKYMKKLYKIPNPCEDAERPKVSKKRRRYFSPEELVDIIKACLDEYELLLILTLIDSACRIGELVRLKGGDVGEGFILVVGKTGERRYRLDERICERLRSFAGDDSLPVFASMSGEFYRSADGLARRVRAVVRRAGITGAKVGPHTIRHSSASMLAQKTGQALIVKALLQHDDIETSMRYIHDVDDMVIKEDEYSPLRILGEGYSGVDKEYDEPQQMELSEVQDSAGMALVPVSSRLKEVKYYELAVDMFPEIKDGVAVRTVLRCDDLKLLREVFIFYARYNDGFMVTRARELMKRMLRKGGSEYYSKGK